MKKAKSVIESGKEVLRLEAKAISSLIPRLDERFSRAVDMILKCKSRVVVTGMGKPGIIAKKLAATLASTGTPAMSLHPAEAVHGDLGMVVKDDVVIAISNSGETEEITKLIPTIKKIGAKLISFSGDMKSTLARNSDIALDIGVKREACPLGLAPTASVAASLAMGDALAAALLKKRGFNVEDYAFFHPGGNLGRKFLKVEDLMRHGKANPVTTESAKVKDVLLIITRARAGAASIVNKNGKVTGIFTDGDLRRHIEKGRTLLEREVVSVMTKNPKTISAACLASEALRILREKKIDELPVIDRNSRPIGMLDVQDLLKAGVV